MAVDAARADAGDAGNQVAFAHARLDGLDDVAVHGRNDLSGDAHVIEFLRALDRALPVDERRGVDEAHVGQLALQRGEGRCREPVIVHLDADDALAPAAFGELGGEHLHGMALARLHVDVRIAEDAVLAHVDGAQRPLHILRAAPPDGIAVARHHHALMDVERPAVIAGEPGHVGRVGDDQRVDAARRHGIAGLGQPIGIFLTGEMERNVGHGVPQLWKRVPALADLARATARVAMAVSCAPVPVRSHRVISPGALRPGAVPAIT